MNELAQLQFECHIEAAAVPSLKDFREENAAASAAKLHEGHTFASPDRPRATAAVEGPAAALYV